MVDSKIEPSINVKSPTYGGLSESQRSSGSSREQSGYGTSIGQATSAYQTPYSSVSGGSSVYNSSVSGTGVSGTPTSNVYQASTQRTTYTSGQGQPVPTYQATSSSAMNQSGTGSGSGVYQSGTGAGSGIYQSGASGSSGSYQQGSYQGSSYQPYQGGYNYRSGTGAPGTTGATGVTGTTETSGTIGAVGTTGTGATGQGSGVSGNQQYSSSSSYRYTQK